MYSPLPICHTSDYPFNDLWTMSPEPESEPILRLDTHDATEVGYCHSGAGILAVEDKVLHFSAGDICLIGERQMHMSRSAISTSSCWSYFWFDYGLLVAAMSDGLSLVASDPFKHPAFPFVFSPTTHRDLCALVRDIVAEMERQEAGYRGIVKGLGMALVGRLVRLYPNLSQGAPAAGREGMERVIPAMHHMTSRYAEPIDVRQLAQLCNLSLRQFERVFLTAIGRTPYQYLAQLRVKMATAMLTDAGKPITQIAYAAGFESINTFNRQFRSVMGMSPRQWRQQRGLRPTSA